MSRNLRKKRHHMGISLSSSPENSNTLWIQEAFIGITTKNYGILLLKFWHLILLLNHHLTMEANHEHRLQILLLKS